MTQLRIILLTCFTLILFVSMGFTKPTEQDCPKNEEYFKCGANCQTECATLNQPCYINYIMCPSGCYCKEGYARNEAGVCIPISECPKKC